MSRPFSSSTRADLQINPKVSNYYTNGSGRVIKSIKTKDTYIRMNNGGFKRMNDLESYRNNCNSKLSRGDITKPVGLNAKVSLYKSDGSGRDQYIK
jgi:hypothetical protein